MQVKKQHLRIFMLAKDDDEDDEDDEDDDDEDPLSQA
jgi:hypothetical protein